MVFVKRCCEQKKKRLRNWWYAAEAVGLPSVFLLLPAGVVEEPRFLLSLKLFVGQNM
jgi:hypothetical protein